MNKSMSNEIYKRIVENMNMRNGLGDILFQHNTPRIVSRNYKFSISFLLLYARDGYNRDITHRSRKLDNDLTWRRLLGQPTDSTFIRPDLMLFCKFKAECTHVIVVHNHT